jgi:hypothetical protein
MQSDSLTFKVEIDRFIWTQQDNESADLTFRLVHQGNGVLAFAAETQAIKDRWLTALRAAVTLEDL